MFLSTLFVMNSLSAQTKLAGLLGGPSILPQTEEAIRTFNKETGFAMEMASGATGQSPYQMVMTWYNSGNTPAVFVMESQDLPKIKDKLIDLSNEKWVKDAYPWTLKGATVDGKLLGMPNGIQGMGLIYNKKVIERALGRPFDPASIQSRKDLKTLLEALQKAGAAPVQISQENWSLAGHFLTHLYSMQGSTEAAVKFNRDLRDGKVDLMKNAIFHGLFNTFDLLMKYNKNAKSPLASTFDKDAMAIGQGKVALWFNGDWAWPVIAAAGPDVRARDFGLLPLPISDNPADAYNSKIMALVGMYTAADKQVNSPSQQAGALKWMDWFVNSSSGQDYAVMKSGSLSAFRSVKVVPENPISLAIKSYLDADKTFSSETSVVVPGDHWTVLGASMQKYLAGKINRAGLAKEIEAYWKKAGKSS